MIKEMHPYAGRFLIALQAPVSLDFLDCLPILKTLVFRICVNIYLIRKKFIASLDLLKHETLEVVLFISGLGWRNLEPGSGIML
jgi:hypothetical protein